MPVKEVLTVISYCGIVMLIFNLLWKSLITIPFAYFFAFIKIYKLSFGVRIIGFYLRASLMGLILSRQLTTSTNQKGFYISLILIVLFLIDNLWAIIYHWAKKCFELLDSTFFDDKEEPFIYNIYLVTFTIMFFVFASFKPYLARNYLSNLILTLFDKGFEIFFLALVFKIFGFLYFVYHIYKLFMRIFFKDNDDYDD